MKVELTYEQVKMIDQAVFDKWMELDKKKDERSKEFEKLSEFIMNIRYKMISEKRKYNG